MWLLDYYNKVLCMSDSYIAAYCVNTNGMTHIRTIKIFAIG